MAMTLKQHLAKLGSKGGKARTEAQRASRAANLAKARAKRWPDKPPKDS